MDADQIGWYIQLLADAWESTSTPQATLPNDEDVLKGHSRYEKSRRRNEELLQSIETALKTVLSVVEGELTKEKVLALIGSVMDHLRVTQDEAFKHRWELVRKQFKTDSQTPHLVYNSRQLAELRRWNKAMEAKREAGKSSAERRWGSGFRQSDQELNDPSLVVPHPLLNGSVMGGPTGNSENLNGPNGSPNALINNLQKDVSKDDTSKKSTGQTDKKDGKTLLKKKSESLFDEAKFKITEGMSAHLRLKYPEFVAGDWDFMVEKFKNVYHGKRYISWSRTFYNFVANQVTQYGYKPGSFDWRGAATKSQSTASDRSARVEREADELSQRYLQSEGPGDNQNDEEALPLAPEDVRDS